MPQYAFRTALRKGVLPVKKPKTVAPQPTPKATANEKRKMDIAARLRQLRISKGYDTARSAAYACGQNMTTYSQHESGERGLRTGQLTEYAKFYGVPVSFLLYGETSGANGMDVSIVGVLEHQLTIEPMAAYPRVLKTVAAPILNTPEKMEAVAVISDDLYPTYSKGDVLFYRSRKTGQPAEKTSGARCVVETDDGARFVRHVVEQSNGLFTLTGDRCPPMSNVKLKYSCRIIFTAHDIRFID